VDKGYSQHTRIPVCIHLGLVLKHTHNIAWLWGEQWAYWRPQLVVLDWLVISRLLTTHTQSLTQGDMDENKAVCWNEW